MGSAFVIGCWHREWTDVARILRGGGSTCYDSMGEVGARTDVNKLRVVCHTVDVAEAMAVRLRGVQE